MAWPLGKSFSEYQTGGYVSFKELAAPILLFRYIKADLPAPTPIYLAALRGWRLVTCRHGASKSTSSAKIPSHEVVFFALNCPTRSDAIVDI